MIDRSHPHISISRQCALASVSKSVYYHRSRPEKPEEVELMHRIDELHTARPYYGIRRLAHVLSTPQQRINPKRMRRLMLKMGITTIYPKPNTSKAAPAHKKYPYLLRGMKVERPNQVWSMDITYIRMQRGFLYLAAVIDWHSRCVLSWKISNTMTIGFVKECLQEAIDKHGHPEIFNTDQGCQFTSPMFTGVWQENNLPEVRISMDGRGRATDNAFIERLWRSVKQEEIYLNQYRDGAELFIALHNYFTFYNTERPHQSLHNQTPQQCYHTNSQTSADKGNTSLSKSITAHPPQNPTQPCHAQL